MPGVTGVARQFNYRLQSPYLLISLKMQMRSNMDNPRNIPDILDLLAPMARDIITPTREREKEGKRMREREGG